MSSTRFKDESQHDVTHKIPDDLSDSGSGPESDCDENDTASVRDQKVTAVIAVIDTSTEDPEYGIEHSKRCRKTDKLLWL
eukprot:scaffold4513_cov37-Cyclotella_meneghiniana.AAC.9